MSSSERPQWTWTPAHTHRAPAVEVDTSPHPYLLGYSLSAHRLEEVVALVYLSQRLVSSQGGVLPRAHVSFQVLASAQLQLTLNWDNDTITA